MALVFGRKRPGRQEAACWDGPNGACFREEAAGAAGGGLLGRAERHLFWGGSGRGGLLGRAEWHLFSGGKAGAWRAS